MLFLSKIIQQLKWIKKHLFEILAILSVIVIIIMGLYRIITGSKGSWADSYYYLPDELLTLKNSKRFKESGSYIESSEISHKNGKESAGEIRTRRYLENKFKKPFNKIRPDFMVNQVTGSKYNLEFDCYNEEMKLAVEYNGAQHYNYIPFFHKNKEAFYNQKYRDELKRIKCKELGITLIEIPYTEEKRLEYFLDEQFKTIGL